MINGCFTGIYNGLLKDKRLERRMEISMLDMLGQGGGSVNKFSLGHSNKIGTYRALANTKFTHDDLLKGSQRRCVQNIDVEHVLCIQDTTELNYWGLRKKLGKTDQDIGPISLKRIPGFLCHPTLVVDASAEKIYGLSSVLVFNRNWQQPDKYQRAYLKLPIEQKESYKWIKSSQQTKEAISERVKLTIIGDRENDIYQDWDRIPDHRTNLLIRSRSDRKLLGSQKTLYEKLENQELAGTTSIRLKNGEGRTARTTVLEIKFCNALIKAPEGLSVNKQGVEVYAILAKEKSGYTPKGEEPVMWRLLTTHPIESLEQAIQCIEWYKTRWLIEELFRVIKTKGYDLESSQLSTGARLKKLLAVTLEVAMHVMRLKQALQTNQDLPASEVFTAKQIQFLKLLLKTVEGKTDKLKNPYKEQTLQWAAWIIARLGSWSGYISQGPPGRITLKDGYQRFLDKFEGYQLFQNEDVYKE